MKIYHVTYWDPCNGMSGRSADRGYFATKPLAEAYIRPLAIGWDTTAYSIREIDVIESVPNVLDVLREFM